MRVDSMIFVLYEADRMVAISVIVRVQELVWEFVIVSMMVSFE